MHLVRHLASIHVGCNMEFLIKKKGKKVEMFVGVGGISKLLEGNFLLQIYHYIN